MHASDHGAPTLQIAEIFASIQGESLAAGRPCAFVRLAGCPLRCAWCDTAWAQDPGAGERLALSEILARIAAFGLPLVEVTGGEPLAQDGCTALLCALHERGWEVLLETSGALDTAGVPRGVRVIMDLKAPSSGQVARMRWENLAALGPDAQIKIALADRADYDWACARMAEHDLGRRWPVLLSPIPGRLDPAALAAWMVGDRLPARLQIQLHKLLWPGAERGV